MYPSRIRMEVHYGQIPPSEFWHKKIPGGFYIEMKKHLLAAAFQGGWIEINRAKSGNG
jgi:hypothetical protein